MTLLKTAEGASSPRPVPRGWWSQLYAAGTDGPETQGARHGLALLLFILILLTVFRVAALFVSPSELGFDEAQYWDWSRHFAFGYFTKPPLIAWIIGIERGLCGDTAACVRLASPLFHFGTAIALALLARRLYGPATGFWTGIFYAILPGVSLSSFLMTTDAPLLFLFALALHPLITYLERPNLTSAFVFGLVVGLGLLAKYAMIYLPVMVVLAAIALPGLRRAVFRPVSLVALLVAFLILSPNLLWNLFNGLATFRHVGGDNIGWSLSRLNAVGGFEFLAAQFGVAGPVIFGAMLNAGLFGLRSEKPETDRLLLWLSLPLVAAITVQGFLSQANANWAAPAYGAGTVLATALILRDRRPIYFLANLAICGSLALALLLVTAVLDPTGAKGPARQFAQLGGWRVTAENIERLAKERGATTLVSESRALTAGLTYALRESSLAVEALLMTGERVEDHYQADRPFQQGEPVTGHLFVGLSDAAAKSLGLVPIAEIVAPIYSNRSGVMTVYGPSGATTVSPSSKSGG
ncbi:MAG: glycosyltransferase family 39 protein [Pseudomonadota bacterium]|nr:glycosyltransferase family 39 protein [Pseudomonadota bacterium]